ncbi:DUF4255 domain-containing protein [Streptomyces sp. NBC_01497]|uniref:DUF4255 domain-containing protein n=1 Tax=Streptomyces sp. NBC_01497 TaxID=2903885 RepID=UPI002E30E5D5|nr:DUF4255 domain-containing protein [Streptomyces sp. NBC_01497]
MIHEVDALLKGLLKGGALAGADVEVSFEAPTRDWAARRNAPAFNIYLFDIREDVKRRERGSMDVRDERGIVVRRRRPPRWFRLSYLVTAWTKLPEDEHRLLSAALATLLPHELVAPERLPDALAALGLSVPVAVSGIQAETRSLAEIWTALGGALKPSLDLVVTVPFPAYPDYDAGPPVTEGAVVRAREIDGPLEDGERAHLPRHLSGAEQEPEAARGSATTTRFGAPPR